jgi:hypothetical protein
MDGKRLATLDAPRLTASPLFDEGLAGGDGKTARLLPPVSSTLNTASAGVVSQQAGKNQPQSDDIIITAKQKTGATPDGVYRFGADQSAYFQLAGGGGNSRNPRTRRGGNGGPALDPLYDPQTIQQIYRPLVGTPGGVAVGIVDPFLDLTGPGFAAADAALDGLAWKYKADIKSLDPSFSFDSIAPNPPTLEYKNNYNAELRFDRAALTYNKLGKIDLLQLETYQFYQRSVDRAYTEALRLDSIGQLKYAPGQRNLAIGNFIDVRARDELKLRLDAPKLSLKIAEGPGKTIEVAVNRRSYGANETNYRIPDVRVGNMVFDATVSYKTATTAQVRGFLNAPGTDTVIIVRPTQLGGSYVIPTKGI